MRHLLESRLGDRIYNNSVIIEWLILWVADMLSKCGMHEKCRTSYDMATQHTVEHKAIGCGESVYFQF